MVYIETADNDTFSEMVELLKKDGYEHRVNYYVAHGCQQDIPYKPLVNNWHRDDRPLDPVTGELLEVDVEIIENDTQRTLYSEFKNERTGDHYYYQDWGKSIEKQIEEDKKEIQNRLAKNKDLSNKTKQRDREIER